MKKNYNKRNKYVLIFSIIIMLVVIFLSTGFAAFQASIDIGNITAFMREQKNVRITNLRYISATNGATILDYNYSANSINGIITLPSNNSTITFQVEVTNIGNVEVGFLGITDLPSPFAYEITGYTEGTKLCDDDDISQCTLGTVSTFNVTIKYANGASVLNEPTFFNGDIIFKEAYDITYMNIANTSNFPSIILKDETLSITFQNDVPYDLKITKGDSTPLASSSYTYSSSGNNKVLTIPIVNSDLIIDRYYSITYELNGGTNNGSNPIKYLRSDNLTINAPTYDSSHTFYGWYETSDFSSSVITSTNDLNGDTILYAKWLSNTELYTINYILNGGTQASGQVTSYYASTPQTILSPSRTNYEFDGWYQYSNFSGNRITSTSDLSGNATLYAKWVAVYTITYNLGSGTQASGQVISFREDAPPQTILNPTNNHGASFAGWYGTSAFSGSSITSTSSITSSTTLYAQWTSTISNASFTDSNYTFTATNTNNLGSYYNFTRNAIYTESSAHCVVNRIKVHLDLSYDHNKSGTLAVEITNTSGNTIGTGNISISKGNTSGEVTITLNTPVQIGNGFTLKFGSFSNGNSNKLSVSGVSFVINP